jgi:hypothetical protein
MIGPSITTNRFRVAWGGLVAGLLVAWPTAHAADRAGNSTVVQGLWAG